MKALAVRQASSIIILESVIPTSDVVVILTKMITEKKSQLKIQTKNVNRHRLKSVSLTFSFSLSDRSSSPSNKSFLYYSLFGEVWLSSFFQASTTKVTKFVLVFTLSTTQRNVSSSGHATFETNVDGDKVQGPKSYQRIFLFI